MNMVTESKMNLIQVMKNKIQMKNERKCYFFS